jgi:hypothetical protein
MSDDLLTLPVCRDENLFSITTHMIFFRRRKARIIFIMPSPRVTYIDVHRVSVTVKFPHARNRYLPPRRVIKRRGIEISGCLVGRSYVIEIPLTM